MNGTLRTDLASTYEQLYVHAEINNITDARKFAANTLRTVFKTDDIKDATILLPPTADAKAINSSIEDIISNPTHYGIAFGNQAGTDTPTVEEARRLLNTDDVVPIATDKGVYLYSMRSQQVVTVETQSGYQPLIIGMDGSIPNAGKAPKAVSPVFESNVITPNPSNRSKKSGTRLGRRQGTLTLREATAEEWAMDAAGQAELKKLPYDTFASKIFIDNNKRKMANGIAHVIKGGNLPTQAVEFLQNSDAFKDLEDKGVLAKVKANWKRSELRDRYNAHNQQMSPLEVLYQMTIEARKIVTEEENKLIMQMYSGGQLGG